MTNRFDLTNMYIVGVPANVLQSAGMLMGGLLRYVVFPTYNLVALALLVNRYI
jgi:hypothetical protein